MSNVPEDAEREFTASSFIVKDGKILLIRHSELDTWLQPGGRIENGETPDETAVRKAREEVNLEVDFDQRFVPDYQSSTSHDLPRPFHVNTHPVEEGTWHCDFCYLMDLDEDTQDYSSPEHEGARWFSKEEIEELEDIPENVQKTAVKALELKR